MPAPKFEKNEEIEGEDTSNLPHYFYGDIDGVLPKLCFCNASLTSPSDGASTCPVEEKTKLKVLSDIRLTSVTYRETSFWRVG